MDLSIIILNYKSKGLLRQCLRGILKSPIKSSYEIIVVDNASNDGTPAMISAEFPTIRCIASPINTGFGQGNNLGIKVSSGRYVAIMNPDLAILDNALDRLVAYLDTHQDVGIVGPKLANPDGSTQFSCYRYPTPMIPIYRRTLLGRTVAGKRALANYLMTDFDHKTERDVDWLLGACLVMRRSVLDKIGLFDKRFFLYFEDTDLCRRVHEAGMRVVYNPTISIVHYHRRLSADGSLVSSLFNEVTRIHIMSAIKYFWKYHSEKGVGGRW